MSKPQRRKGNAKTASSAGAANVLGDYTPSMIGFNPDMNIFDMSSTSVESGAEVGAETRNVLKKLMKKDPHTREKGIRELLEKSPEFETSELEATFIHFAGIFDRLSTDGSQTVRMLSLKLASSFVGLLKKSAQKHLKKIIPYVILSMNDVSNSVCGQANSFFSDNFQGEKREQAICAFSQAAVDVAVEILKNSSDLCQPTKYDDEEDKEQRTDRLTVQSLATLQRLIPTTSETVKLLESVEPIFHDNGNLKKIFASEKINIKTGLLSVCAVLPNRLEVITASQPLLTNIMGGLDAKEERFCQLSWELFLCLAKEPSFYEKMNLNKTVIPKVLFAIRQKQDHWQIMGPMLLPTIAFIHKQLPAEERTKWLISAIESTTDKLPFATSASVTAWAPAVCEMLKWSLSQHREDEDRTLQVFTVDFLLRLLIQVVTWTQEEVVPQFVILIQWILEKNVWNNEESAMFIRTLKLNILNAPEENRDLVDCLIGLQHQKLAPIHVAVLNSDSVRFQAFEALATAPDQYFEEVLKGIKLLELVEPTKCWSESQAATIVKLILKSKMEDFKIANDYVGRKLYLESLSHNRSAVVADEVVGGMIEFWTGANVAEVYKQPERRGIVGKKLLETINETKSTFIVEFLKAADAIEPNLQQHLSNQLFKSLFLQNSFSEESLVILEKNKPSKEVSDDYLFEQIGKMTAVDHSRLISMNHLCENIRRTSPTLAEAVSFKEEHFDALLDAFAQLSSDALYESSVLPTVMTEHKPRPLDHKLLLDAACFAFIWGTEEISAYGFLVKAIDDLYRKRNAFEDADENLKWILDDLKETLNLEKAREQLVSAYNRRPSVLLLYTLNLVKVHESSQNFELPLLEAASLQMKSASNKLAGQTVAKWAYKLNEETGASLIEQMKSVLDDGSADKIEEMIFAFSTENEASMQLNLTLLRAWNEMEKTTSALAITEDKTIIDFLLCGLVAIFDTLHDQRRPQGENILLDSMAALALRVFSRLAHTARNLEATQENSVNEWNDFFAPVIIRIVFHWWAGIEHESPSTPYVRALYWAVINISKVPEDYEDIASTSTAKFLPNLDAFKYPPHEQAVIIHAFEQLKSENILVQLMGLHVIKLMMPKMLLAENLALMKGEEDEYTLKKDGILIPTMLLTAEEDWKGSDNRLAYVLDAAIFPLKDGELEGDQRVMYCEALNPLIKSILPKVISAFPEGIPKSQERDYLVTSDPTPSPEFYHKYNANLLFRVLGRLPALTRSWYNSLPTQAAGIVSRVVRTSISKYLIERELDKVKIGKKNDPAGQSLKIRVVPAASQVVAEYTVEETTMRLCISMPADWPLSVPPIELDKAIVKNERAKKWLRQLATYLFYQNGSMVEGITMWQKNVDRDVDGAESCTICMMTIHATSHQLPKTKCKQCKNKFHPQCLYKWFESSNQSSCPLCRASFT